MVEGTAFINGEYVPVKDAKISILDFGLIHADATYDVAHVIDGKIFRLDWHLERFFSSAKGLRIEVPYTKGEIIEIVKTCLKKEDLRDAFIWMGCTRGIPESGSPRDLLSCKPQFFTYVKPYYGILKNKKKGEGISLLITDIIRIPKEAINPVYKNFHWGDLTKAQFAAIDKGLDTGLTVDINGNIEEGPGFNVFMVKKGLVITPRQGMLEGVTRRSILQICKEVNIPTELRDIPSEEMFNDADEVFISSTSGGVTEVNQLYLGKKKRDFRTNSIAEKLSGLYWEKHRDPEWTMPID